MGAVIRYLQNPFGTRVRRIDIAPGRPVLTTVRAALPELADAPLLILRNGRALAGDEIVAEGDIIMVTPRPEGIEITAAIVWKIVITALVSAAVSYLVGYLTRPKKKDKSASPAYSIQIDQNAARPGEPVPVIYGRVLATPDIATQPYTEFENHNEKLSMILCLGMGQYQINGVFIGDSNAVDFPSGTVQWWAVPPSVHHQTLGNIQKLTGIAEDMITIAEASGVDIAAPNDPAELTIAATVNGGTITPTDPGQVNVWGTLRVGQAYIVANSLGQQVVVTFVGWGANNSAVFDGPLPPRPAEIVTPISAALTAITDQRYGPMLRLGHSITTVRTGELIFVKPAGAADSQLRGPLQATDSRNAAWLDLALSGPGFTSRNNAPIPLGALHVIRNRYVTYSFTEYHPATGLPGWRWRGWYAVCPPGVRADMCYFDVVMPNGVAWVTDDGDYRETSMWMGFEYQEIDDDGVPVGLAGGWPGQRIAGATSNPQRVTFGFTFPKVARYRVRMTRTNDRDQRASKEISAGILSAVRARVYHAANTPAYENCTLIALRFAASAALNAASNRRIRVDATRLLPNLGVGALVGGSSPANAFIDAYTNVDYGGARPLAEVDSATLARLAPQWLTTSGFNAVMDRSSTLIETLQAILGPVRAMPLPMGKIMSVAQDAPRDRDYVFGPDTIVADSLSIGYNFDGEDHNDCLEVIYTDPDTFADARVYYPKQGVNPETLELFGCTNRAHALSWARLAWQERIYNRKSCQYELEGEGYLINPLTRFGLAIPDIFWGNSGQVLAYDAATRRLTLDGPYTTGRRLHFKTNTGQLAAPPVAVQSVTNAYVVTLAADPPVPVHGPDAAGEGTRWVMERSEAVQFFEFRVTDLETTGVMRVKVTGTQYTDAVYAGTFVENWIT